MVTASTVLLSAAVVAFILIAAASMARVSFSPLSFTFQAIAKEPRLVMPDCTDSDRGIDPMEAGRIMFTEGGATVVRSDYCRSERVLVEWYCDAGLSKKRDIVCGEIASGVAYCGQAQCRQ